MYRIVIHGGAGLSTPQDLGSAREQIARSALKDSLIQADKVLSTGGTALDAVQTAVQIMEDSEVFNAGKGSVFAADGVQRMDASIMDGKTMKAGALCGVSTIRYPIQAARTIMEKTPHVMLYGQDAENLAQENGLQIVPQTWFHTEYRWNQLQRAIAAKKIILDHESVDKGMSKGTVGAVALDIHGNVAAATSTGGLVNKMPGRVGDSALIGAGTYAKNSTCAVSATGHGELFIRRNVAGRMSDLIELAQLSLAQAAKRIVFTELPDDCGGLIACDTAGNITMPFNTGGMFRGYLTEEQIPNVYVWREQ